MGHSQLLQDLAGVRTWVNDSRENTPAPSESRPDYADGQPKRDRVLPLPSGHPEGRDENRAGPPVFNGPSDSSGASHSYSKAPNQNAKPDQKPLHQRPRSSGLPGEEYGHPYIDQSTSTGLKRRVAESLMGEILDFYLDDDDFYHDIDEYEDLIKVALISVRPPKQRQRKQKGQARREYKLRRMKLRTKNKSKMRSKRKRYYLRNKHRIKRYNQRRRKQPNRFKRYEGGGVSSQRQRNQKSRKATIEEILSMSYFDIDEKGLLVERYNEPEYDDEYDEDYDDEYDDEYDEDYDGYAEDPYADDLEGLRLAEDMTAEELLAYKRMNPAQRRKMTKSRSRGSKNRPDRLKRRKKDKKNKAKIRRQQKQWRRKNKSKIKRRASYEPKLEILQALLAILRAVHWSHWTSHWQVKGDTSYGDHLLMERLYTGVEDEIDTLAEKIVGEYGPASVAPVSQAEQMTEALVNQNISTPIERALLTEENLQIALKRVYEMLKQLDNMSLGLDDYIMSIANAHETNLYLLRQRKRG